MKYTAIILLLLLSSCYTRNKAQQQFGKAAITYPEIPADYCARTYPAKDSLIKGDTVLKFDTIYEGGQTYIDTVVINDTVRIVKTVQLPGKTITQRITIRDTIIKVNTAAVDQCAILRDNAILLAMDKTKEAAKWRKLAKQRFWILTALVGGAVLGLIFLVSRKKQIPRN